MNLQTQTYRYNQSQKPIKKPTKKLLTKQTHPDNLQSQIQIINHKKTNNHSILSTFVAQRLNRNKQIGLNKSEYVKIKQQFINNFQVSKKITQIRAKRYNNSQLNQRTSEKMNQDQKERYQNYKNNNNIQNYQRKYLQQQAETMNISFLRNKSNQKHNSSEKIKKTIIVQSQHTMKKPIFTKQIVNIYSHPIQQSHKQGIIDNRQNFIEGKAVSIEQKQKILFHKAKMSYRDVVRYDNTSGKIKIPLKNTQKTNEHSRSPLKDKQSNENQRNKNLYKNENLQRRINKIMSEKKQKY